MLRKSGASSTPGRLQLKMAGAEYWIIRFRG
jgi:hypothetical protein